LVQDNIERVGPQLLRDKTNHNNWIRAFNDISNIVNDVLKNGAQLAIVSRNPSKDLCDRALYYFNTINPSDNKEWSIIHLVKYNEVVNESKANHFRRIRTWSASDFSDLLLFDDEAFNNVVRIELGVTFQLVRDQQGLTWNTYQQGINAWRRAKNVTILRNPASARRRAVIGYSGLPTTWIDLVRKGEGVVDPKTPYRWGYALYVAPSLAIANYFVGMNGNWMTAKSHVCEVWVKDYDAWAGINKIWVPEHSGNLPQMNNMSWSAEMTGRNQEDRDRFIGNNWNVHTPYVLFSRHHWMPGMPNPLGRRWSEMVIYTQIQRSLFEVVPLTDAQVKQIGNSCPYPFRHQFKTWNIHAPPLTRQEFLRYKENEFYRFSA